MRIVYVAHFKTGTLAGETARTEGGETALVRHFGKGVGLVHELRQCVRTEEAVDNARDGLGVNQVGRGKYFVVANVHALADGAAHTGQTYGKLITQLFANRTHTAVTEVVNIVNGCLGVDEFNEILDNLNDILLREYAHVFISVKVQLFVDAIAAHLSEVVAFF